MKDKYDLGVTQLLIKSYAGISFRIILALYKALTVNKNSTKYIKEKWESELSIDITDQQWQEMWKTHQTTTSSQSWREFSWKNLIWFFITPKIKNKYSKTNYLCWRECGELEAGHAPIFWKCNKTVRFWGMVHSVMQKILGYNIPMNCETLYMCNLNEWHIHRV